MKDTIVKQATFNQSIDTVWNAISKGDEISKWFLSADFKAEKGYQYTFKSPKNDCEPIVGEVKEASPYTLAYTWIVQGTEVETLVRWTLTPTNSGTHLLLEHSGIENYADATALEMFESFNGGWDNCLNGLENFLKVAAHAG